MNRKLRMGMTMVRVREGYKNDGIKMWRIGKTIRINKDKYKIKMRKMRMRITMTSSTRETMMTITTIFSPRPANKESFYSHTTAEHCTCWATRS